MKAFFRIIVCLSCLLFVLPGCKNLQPDTTEPTEDSLTVSPTVVVFGLDGTGTKYVTINTSGAWTATADAAWLHLAPASGTGNGAITLTADKSTESRKATITIKAGGKDATVSVTQGEASFVPQPAEFDGNKRSSTTYQLLIYSFADSDGDGVGDFKGIQNKLDYLDALGVTALWLSPAHPTSSYHAYDVNDYYSLNPLYAVGEKTSAKAEADFKELLEAAHAKDIKIYMDYVLNHSGTGTEWFKSVKADPKNSPYRDYYVLSNGEYVPEAVGGMGGWVSLGDGYPGYKGKLHFKVDWNKKTVTVTESTETPQSSNASASVWLWIGKNAKFVGLYESKTEPGIHEITMDVDTDWGFLVTTTNNWDTATKYGAKGGANVITFGQAMSLVKDANDIVFGETTSYYASFDGSMPDLNYGNPATCENSRAFISTVESAIKWVEMGVDGFRLDAVVWIYGSIASSNAQFLGKWYNAVNEAYKAKHSDDIFMVGEAWHGGHAQEQKYYAGLPSNFEFDYWRNALQPAVNGGQGSNYASAVMGYISDHTANRTASPKAITSFFMTNHDKSSVKAKQNPYNPNEWLSFYRAADDLGKDLSKEKQACAMLLTTPGKPFIYQGEELGYWRIDDDDKLDDEYIRAPIVWNSSATECAKKGVNNKVDNSMLKGSISVETQSADENSLLNTYKTWGRLRNTYPALADGEMSATAISGSSIASWYMTSGKQKLLVIHNVAGSKKSCTVTDSMAKPIALLGTGLISGTTLTLGAHSSVVFEL